MSPLYESLIRIQKRLADEGIKSAVIGGIAVSLWSRPRATDDVDFKVLLRRNEAQRLLDALGKDYTAIQSDPTESLRRNGVLFVRDETGIRIDIQLADMGFDDSAIERAVPIELEPGVSARVCTAEDLVIYKMLSARLQDQVDVEQIIRRQGDALDDRYVLRWLRLFEKALTDSMLVTTYRRLRKE